MTSIYDGIEVRVDPYLPEDKIYILALEGVPALPKQDGESEEDFRDRWVKHAVAHGAILVVKNLDLLRGSKWEA